VAALAMDCVLARLQPARLIFSATGLREGLLYEQLPPAVKKQDALIAGCGKFAMKTSRFDDLKYFHSLSRWMEPLFAGEDAEVLRLIEASCLLSDTCGFEHEDYQAEQAFSRIFVLPLSAVDHAGRAFLALSQYVRYKGYLRRVTRAREAPDVTSPAQKILDARMTDLAVRAGLAQRMAYLLTGGALDLLKHASFKLTPKNLTLKLDEKADTLNAHVIEDALREIAAGMGKEAVIA
jgi:exopolyphosphatase/guanosine-5'-triphosphate,3'-diphosphate pyrophosphatase